MGRPRLMEGRTVLSISLGAHALLQVRRHAKRHNISVAEVIRRALAQYFHLPSDMNHIQ